MSNLNFNFLERYIARKIMSKVKEIAECKDDSVISNGFSLFLNNKWIRVNVSLEKNNNIGGNLLSHSEYNLIKNQQNDL